PPAARLSDSAAFRVCPLRSPAARKGPGTSPTPGTRAHTAARHDSSSSPALTPKPRRRTRLTARDGSPMARGRSGSSWLVLSRSFLEGLLALLDVVQRELTGFNQVSHHQLRPAAEDRHQFVN